MCLQDDLYFIRTKAIALLQDQLATLLPQKNERDELLDGAKINCNRLQILCFWLIKNSCDLDGRDMFILMYFGGTNLSAQLKEVLGAAFVGRKCYHIWNKKAAITPIITLVYETWSGEKELKK